MLSTENPPPDPLSCPCKQVSQPLKSANSSDENDSSDKLVDEQIDLFQSGLLDDNTTNINNDNPLPRFSIRDYVFTTRSKDIRTNWPFSQKNLQLCLRHGVIDVLPPFQSLGTLRNPSIAKCIAESCSVVQENLSKLDGESSGPGTHIVSLALNEELASHLEDKRVVRSEVEKEFLSTTTSQSCSEIDSVPKNHTPHLELEVDTLQEPQLSAGKLEAASSSAFAHFENGTQTPIKKCRLVLKLSNFAGTSNEDITTGNFVVSEAMASKVCPVCKTFSSSSNTTLNAHIDQCLSGESKIKWTENSDRVIKHRVKPRKTRLMVDIYATARRCTLEDLDRRNGTSWALTSSLPAQEDEMCAEEKIESPPPVHVDDDAGNEGAVYVDANGQKLRILSKSSDLSSLLKSTDGTNIKLKKGDGGSKYLLSKKKKKIHAQKHQRLQKHASNGKRHFFSKPHRSSEVRGNQETTDEIRETEAVRPKAQDDIKIQDSGIIGSWVRSKRTGLSEKFKGRDDQQHSGCDASMDGPAETESYMKRNCGPKAQNLLDNNIHSPEGSTRRVKVSRGPHGDLTEQPMGRKRTGVSLSESQLVHDKKSSPLLHSRSNLKQSRNHGPFVHDTYKHPLKRDVDHVHREKNDAGLVSAEDVSMPSSEYNASQRKARKFSSLRKNLLPASRKSRPESRSNLKRKFSAVKESQQCSIPESHNERVGWPSSVDQAHDLMECASEPLARKEKSFEKVPVLGTSKLRKKRGKMMISRSKESLVPENTRSMSEARLHAAGVETSSSLKAGTVPIDTSNDIESGANEVQAHEKDMVVQPSSSQMDSQGGFLGFSKSLSSSYSELPDCNDAEHDLQQFVDACQEPFVGVSACGQSVLSGSQEMVCANEIGKSLTGENTHMMMGYGSDSREGNHLAEIDPIPIPGPPGSFLPSPGKMGSDDLQGTSSLTTSRDQSSEECHELLDGNSSDSPVSAVSTISNSNLARFDSRSMGKNSAGSEAVQNEMKPATRGANLDPLVETSNRVPQAANAEVDRFYSEDSDVNLNFSGKGLYRFNKDQPCCCVRKEGASLGMTLNFQESQILRRRTLGSVPLSNNEKQINGESRLDILYSKPAKLPVSPTSLGHENYSATRPPLMGHLPMKAMTTSEIKFSSRSDCESVSPSTSNPVLRLMGKNLMVINKDEDMYSQPKLTHSSVVNDGTYEQLHKVEVLSSNVQSQDSHSVNPVVPRGPFPVEQIQESSVMQHSVSQLSNSVRYDNNFRMPQTSCHASSIVLEGKSATDGFTGFLEGHNYSGGFAFSTDQLRSKGQWSNPRICDTDKAIATPGSRSRNASAAAKTVKEIIIIDDSPDSDPDSATNGTYNQTTRKGGVASSHIPGSLTTGYDLGHVNPLNGCQPDGYSSGYNASGAVYDASFRNGLRSPVKWNGFKEHFIMTHSDPLAATSSSSGYSASATAYNAAVRHAMLGSPVKWNGTNEHSNMAHSGPLTATSSSAGHVRSTFCYPPGFS